MSVSLNKLPGVDAVTVSLNHGMATMRMQPGNGLTLERIRQAVIDNGFTPKEAKVTVAGKFVLVDGKLAFQVRGAETVYHIKFNPEAGRTEVQLRNDLEQPLQVTGVIQAEEETHPSIFEISAIQKEE